MNDATTSGRDRLVDPVDRVAEALFGLIMAVTIVGSISIAEAGRNDVRTVLIAALGCNLAWGLVDAVMYLVRTLVERTRNAALAARVVGADAATAQRIIAGTLPAHVAALAGPVELEGMRRRLLDLGAPERRFLGAADFATAFGIFLFVVVATFPVVIPFLVTDDLARAMNGSRIVTLAMLFIAGYTLGRYSHDPHPVRIGAFAALFGAALIVAVMALGG
jgi:VIT1/CCC1 family predicted Fe2+/Mn2+ transporter